MRWLVPHFLPQSSIVTLAGEPGHGKSYLSYYLGLALATGTNFLDYKTNPQCVLYFDQENSRPDRDQYLRWAWHGLGKPDLALLEENFWANHFGLGGKDWMAKAQRLILLIQPKLLVFDTANPCFDIKDENDNGEASAVIEKLRQLAALTEPHASILILKHAKLMGMQGEPRTIRGAKAWLGAVDAVIYHVRNAGPPRADGLNGTYLQPAKTRAFGLRHKITIDAQWTGAGREGLRLDRH